MKRFLTLFCGVAIFAAAPTAQAQIEWAAGAPGGTSGGSIEVIGGNPILDTGIAAAAVGGNRNDADLDGLPDSTDYTISAWINSSVDDGGGNAESDHWWFGTGNQGIHLGVLNAPEVDFIPGPVSALRHGHWGSDNSGTTSLPSNAWVHATYVFDADGGTLGTGSVTIYQDGVSEGTFDTVAPNNSSTNLIIGARNGGEAGWVGFIDDVAVFNTALSAADVTTLASNTSQAVTLGAVAYYDFEDDQTGTTADSAVAGGLGQQLDGVGAALPPLANWTTGAPNGTSGGAILLDGANSSFLGTGIPAAEVGGNRGDADGDGLPDSTDYTISAWINSAEEDAAVPGNAANDRWWLGHGSQGLHLGVFNGSALRQGHWGADNGGTTVVPVNTWVHSTTTFDADGGSLGTGEVTIYYNGVSEGSFDAIAPNRSANDLIIGSRSGGRESWNGSIDDVAIFTSVLSAADVATLAADTSQAVSLGAVAYYDFEDDQTGTTAANGGPLGFPELNQIGEPITDVPVLKGDVDLDGGVTFLDIQPFIGVLSSNGFQLEADCDCDGAVTFLDIQPFINILATGSP